MPDKKKSGEVVPFSQDARFYYKRGVKFLEADDEERAEQYLRKAHNMEPYDVEYALALAEVLHRMRCFEESLHVLLLSCPFEGISGEALYGIAANFMGLEEFSAAQQCAELSLQRDPDGAFARSASDLLELIDDQPELEDQIGLTEDEDFDLLVMIHVAKAKHYAGLDEDALAVLLHASERYPKSEMLDLEIAMLYFSLRIFDEAEKRLFNLFKRNSKSVRGNALMALLYHAQKREKQAQEQAQKISIDDDCSPEELGYAGAVLLELEQYERARTALTMLQESVPFDREMLHQIAYCDCMLGDTDEAEKIYHGLVRRDEDDTVAAYYWKRVREQGDKAMAKDWSIGYDVPIGEAILRQRRIRDVAAGGQTAIRQVWQDDPSFRKLLRWAMCSPLVSSQRAIAKMLAMTGDKEAERILREYLMEFDVSDEDKQFVFGILLSIEAKPPFSLYYNAAWQYGVMRPMMIPERMPTGYEYVLELILNVEALVHSQMKYGTLELPSRTSEIAARIYYFYVASLNESFPKITQNQERAMAAAFVMMGLGALNEESVTPEAICETYGVTRRRLENALQKIFKNLQAPEKEE